MAIIIPPEQLAPETFQRLLEEFVTREGTDNGDDSSLEDRVMRVRQALVARKAFVVYDEASEQCGLLMKQDVPRELLEE